MVQKFDLSLFPNFQFFSFTLLFTFSTVGTFFAVATIVHFDKLQILTWAEK